jgi:hypothetical protein
MRITRLIAVAVTFLGIVSPSSARAQGFEGVITTRQVTLGERALSLLLDPADLEAGRIDHHAVFALPMEEILELAHQLDSDVGIDSLVYSMKGSQLRVSGDFSDEMPGYALLDFGAGIFRLVQPAQKMYLELTREDFETYKAMAAEPEPSTSALQARPTGATKVINDMACSAYEIETDAWITLAWVTPELEDLVGAFVEFESRMKEMGMTETGDESQVFSVVAQHGFPVMEQTFTMFDSYAVEYEIREVLNVERRPLTAELFTVPADFQKLGIMEMLRQMGGEK